jgi:hypothetical protein
MRIEEDNSFLIAYYPRRLSWRSLQHTDRCKYKVAQFQNSISKAQPYRAIPVATMSGVKSKPCTVVHRPSQSFQHPSMHAFYA